MANIFVHAVIAIIAVVIGGYILVSKKGTGLHRRLGWLWVACLAVVSLSGIFIQEINPGRYSYIHLLIPFTLISMAYAIFAIRRYKTTRRRRWKYAHINAMIGVYLGLVIAGAFTLLPGRMIHELLFG